MLHIKYTNTLKHGRILLKLSSMLALTSLALAPAYVSAGQSWYGHGNNRHAAVCSKTSRLAFTACRSDILDNYFLQLGKCKNVSNADDRAVCMEEAKDTLKEEKQLCGEQLDARLDVCDQVGESAYDPDIQPADFLSPADTAANPNPWFPLVPGTTRIYKGGDETITVKVMENTRKILGITTIEVSDIVTIDGVPVEDTLDWYAQDLYGNVWYFGEVAQNFEAGVLSNLDGSWTAGVDGAKPGIVMEAAPQVGDVYRQEFLLGEAEDMADVLDTYGTESTPAAACTGDCVVTHEFTPMDSEANEEKYYAPGIGNILVIDVVSGTREELVELIPPAP
jgi:hypothetical protein